MLHTKLRRNFRATVITIDKESEEIYSGSMNVLWDQKALIFYGNTQRIHSKPRLK